jgi:hypothetical protein
MVVWTGFIWLRLQRMEELSRKHKRPKRIRPLDHKS